MSEPNRLRLDAIRTRLETMTATSHQRKQCLHCGADICERCCQSWPCSAAQTPDDIAYLLSEAEHLRASRDHWRREVAQAVYFLETGKRDYAIAILARLLEEAS